MTDPDQPQDLITIGRLANYLQQLILLDMVARVIEAQKKGDDYLPLLKSLSDYAESQVEREKAQQRPDEPCADD